MSALFSLFSDLVFCLLKFLCRHFTNAVAVLSAHTSYHTNTISNDSHEKIWSRCEVGYHIRHLNQSLEIHANNKKAQPAEPITS